MGSKAEKLEKPRFLMVLKLRNEFESWKSLKNPGFWWFWGFAVRSKIEKAVKT